MYKPPMSYVMAMRVYELNRNTNKLFTSVHHGWDESAYAFMLDQEASKLFY